MALFEQRITALSIAYMARQQRNVRRNGSITSLDRVVYYWVKSPLISLIAVIEARFYL